MKLDRVQQRTEFLKSAGWEDSESVALQQDASFRQYFRITKNKDAAILMDAPPPMENVSAFLDISRRLKVTGVKVPNIYFSDRKLGFILLEDLGDQTFTRLLDRGVEEHTLYRHAFNALTKFQRSPNLDIAGLNSYDHYAILKETRLFRDWYLPAIKGQRLCADSQLEFDEIWTALEKQIPNLGSVLVHRDFHVDNLMMVENECALVDYQDALRGSPIYDLVSLLEDARRDVADSIQSDLKTLFLKNNPEIDHSDFEIQFSFWAAQRHCKVAGIFTRLWIRDGKSDYLKHIPRVLRLLKQHLSHPALGSLSNWIERQTEGLTIIPNLDAEEKLKKLLLNE